MRILLVEDDPEIGIMLKDYLETENFEVVMAHDGGKHAINLQLPVLISFFLI